MRRSRILLLILAVGGAAAGAAALRYLDRSVPIGTAYFAKILCSGVFVSGRQAEDVLAADLFYMSGYEGQDVFIVPSADAVVVRLGMTHDGSRWDWPPFLAGVLAALAELPAES